MARSVWLFLLFAASAGYAEERCYTEAELEAEVGVGFVTGQGAGAFLCDKSFPDLQLFARHQDVLRKFKSKFAGFSNVLASQFQRTWPQTWQGRYEQYIEERAREVATIFKNQITRPLCDEFGRKLDERLRSEWTIIQRDLEANVMATRSQVRKCTQ